MITKTRSTASRALPLSLGGVVRPPDIPTETGARRRNKLQRNQQIMPVTLHTKSGVSPSLIGIDLLPLDGGMTAGLCPR